MTPGVSECNVKQTRIFQSLTTEEKKAVKRYDGRWWRFAIISFIIVSVNLIPSSLLVKQGVNAWLIVAAVCLCVGLVFVFGVVGPISSFNDLVNNGRVVVLTGFAREFYCKVELLLSGGPAWQRKRELAYMFDIFVELQKLQSRLDDPGSMDSKDTFDIYRKTFDQLLDTMHNEERRLNELFS